MNFETSPGSVPLPQDILATISARLTAHPRVPRTRHFTADGAARYANRLCLESSPYLLQHAHNPVDWRPWNDETLAFARESNRPILVSIGYSTCHWCHVMEEESFEDPEIAAVLNRNFVPIKVDREERPDVDAVYMRAVQMLTGGGGWPLNVFLTPQGEPFWGGTYFPARDGDRGASMGFLSVLRRLAEVWEEEPERIAESSASITSALQSSLRQSAVSGQLAPEIWPKAMQFYMQHFDPMYGGLQGAPKFPATLPIGILLRYARRTGLSGPAAMARKTLHCMADSGMYDQIGGGFHRYSTDERWLVPHFEKMLYDNALLVSGYLDGFLALREDRFAQVATDICAYIVREMTDALGGFYSATDADSLTPSGHAEEGYFFTWTLDELRAALGADDALVAELYYRMSAKGNFEGRNIPTRPTDAGAIAAKLGLTPAELEKRIDLIRERLRVLRTTRKAPHLDDKIITSWNGLMISAFARAGAILKQEKFLSAAEKGAAFLLNVLMVQGRLHRSWCRGVLGPVGYLSDYANLIGGLLDLFEAGQKRTWLDEAVRLTDDMIRLFADEDVGGFYRTAADQEQLIVRDKPAEDAALPSGNSQAVMVLFRLAALTHEEKYFLLAEKTLRLFLADAKDVHGRAEMLAALDWYLDRPKEILVVTQKGELHQADALRDMVWSMYLPNKALRVEEERIGFGPATIGGKVTAHLCEKGTCHPPLVNEEKIEAVLSRVDLIAVP